ncbi:MAG: hypothetical protein Q7V20_09105 [Aquabacterium sp.]|uniref:hypothetical protein n=1 Tax=Aquabacterium sp. TaxID=1872578 RepID=UPI002728B6C8|nr:hypothetical protein [Aquabacterium sp.]MDO9003595.1 hypothetical protein [Aquabacterium sp.]
MDIDVAQIGKWGAIAATLGITGILGTISPKLFDLWLKAREKADEIQVGFGTISPEPVPYPALHVISRRDHQMQLADYGFITVDGKLCSIAATNAFDYDPEWGFDCRGTTMLAKRNDRFECWMSHHPTPIGAYAQTSTQTKPTVAFHKDIGLLKRTVVKLSIKYRKRWDWQNHWDWSPWLLKLLGKQHKGPFD